MNRDFDLKVSIVIPSFNNFKSFKRTLDSVLMQKFQNYEIVVTDDSSDDVIKDFISGLDNNKIKYYKNQIKLGAPENWNEGIRKANGEYIKILHHDDWLADENSLEKFVKLLDEHPECDFAYAKSVNVEAEGGKIKKRKAEKYVGRLQKDPFELFLTNRIGAPSVIIFRNGRNLFFDKNLQWLVDVDFYLHCLIQNNNIAFLNEVLVNIGISETQMTKTCENNGKLGICEHFYLYNKYKHHLKDKKYINRVIETLNYFRIDDLDVLKQILSEGVEIPEEIIKYLSKGTPWLKNLFYF